VILVLAGLLLVGIPPEIALIFAGIAPSTAPAATTDVVHEMRSEGNFTRSLLGIVALDDALGIVAFTFMLAFAQGMNNHDESMGVILTGSWELAGACLIGFALGLPLSFLARRLDHGESMLMVALGTLFLCNGLSVLLEVSLPLAAMALGAVTANFAREHPGPLIAINEVKLPFKVLFFVMVGASLHIKSLAEIEILGASYILLRAAGRIVGAWPGAAIARSGPVVKKWMGMALMPQAGLALGMAVFATEQFPEIRDTILPVVIGTTVIFELVGPALTRTALIRAGEVPER
jgi:Kef-type K+ transport system membrane component KefB